LEHYEILLVDISIVVSIEEAAAECRRAVIHAGKAHLEDAEVGLVDVAVIVGIRKWIIGQTMGVGLAVRIGAIDQGVIVIVDAVIADLLGAYWIIEARRIIAVDQFVAVVVDSIVADLAALVDLAVLIVIDGVSTDFNTDGGAVRIVAVNPKVAIVIDHVVADLDGRRGASGFRSAIGVLAVDSPVAVIVHSVAANLGRGWTRGQDQLVRVGGGRPAL